MYSRGNVSCVSFLKAEFSTKLNSVQKALNLDEKKLVYQINLNEAETSEERNSDSPLRYKNVLRKNIVCKL